MSLKTYLESIQGKTIGVMGIGVSNTPLIELLLDAGFAVTACDKRERSQFDEALLTDLEGKGCRLVLGADYLDHLDQDIIFRTPGLHPKYLEKAKARGSRITSEMEVFFEVCPCPIIGVTGSDGKTTTTTIIAQLLTAAGRNVYLGGNIGHPLLAEADTMSADGVAVLELSSFQLMTMERSPQIAVLTNLAPNHLDVHTDMAEYVAAKERIFQFQSPMDKLVCNGDNAITRELAQKAASKVFYFTRKEDPSLGAFLWEKAIWMRNDAGVRVVLPLSDIRLPGIHNVENYMAAIAAVDGLVEDEAIRIFARNFGGVEHRIEFVRELHGVRWFNDAIASSPSRTAACLHSFDQKIILLAGGKDKGVSYKDLGPLINDHVKYLILCGATAKVIRESVEQAENYQGLPIAEVSDWAEAVRHAAAVANEGDVVVMSPASTSFDRFPNFMEKGKFFKEQVNRLA